MLLAPGLAIHLAAFSPRRSLFRSPPPPPNSISVLATVTLGAVLAHTAAALVLIANDHIASHLASPVRWPFDPDVYRTALAAAHGGGMDEGELASLLTFSLILSVVTYTAAAAAFGVPPVTDYVARALFGWAARLPRSVGETKVVIAYVLTDTDIEGAHVGYEGVLLEVGLNTDKSIVSILLAEATIFHLRQSRGHVRHVVDSRSDPIALMHVEGSRIRNVAFTLVEIGSPLAQTSNDAPRRA